MPRNGGGIYSLPSGYKANTGELIITDQHNPPLEDIRDDLNAARPVVAGGTGATTASGARTALSVPSVSDVQSGYIPKIASKTALSALDTATFKAAVLTETSREKLWIWKTGDFSTEEAADTDHVNYIAADGISTSLGCWVAATGDGVTVRTISAGGTGADNASDALDNLGGMAAATYDPNSVGGDAFDQDNMVDGTTNKNYTATEKTKLSGIEALADVTDATNVAAAGAVMQTATDASGFDFVNSAGPLANSATTVPAESVAKSYVDTGTVYKVADRTALKAVDTGAHSTAFLEDDQRTSVFDSSDLSAEITAAAGDESLYVAPTSDTTGASGAWVLAADDGLYFKPRPVAAPSFVRKIRDKLNDRADFRDWSVKADGSNDDTVSFLNAIADMKTAGGGRIFVPPGRIMLSDTATIDFDGLHIIGDSQQMSVFDFAGQVSGNGLVVESNVEFWAIENVRVQNAYGHNILVQSTSGGSLIPSRACFRNVKSQFSRTGSGLYAVDGFLVELDNVLCQGNARYGFEFNGYHTTINARDCQGLSNLLGGWKVGDISYSLLQTCAADKNGDTNDDGTADGSAGYGYVIQNMQAVSLKSCGAESNMGAAILAQSTGTIESGALAPGFEGVSIENFFSYNNNRNAVSEASFLDLQCDTNTTNPRTVMVESCVDRTPNGSPSIHAEGQVTVRTRGDNRLAGGFSIETFARLDQEKLPYRQNSGLSVTAANTPVCGLTDSHGQTQYYTGTVTVTARNKKWADAGTGANVAVYQLLVSKYNGGVNVTTIASAGQTAGTSANHPSFTWALDGTNNQLEATPVGSTSGTFFFHVESVGDLMVGAP